MRKIAYLISAYTEPLSLKKLVDALSCEWADFIIHIDKRVDITPFANILKDKNNVCFLPENERVKVKWGGILKLSIKEI